MKNLITAAACIVLILAFIIQFGQAEINQGKEMYVQRQIHTAKELAKQEGYFTPEIVDNLQTNISDKLGIEKDEVIVVATGKSDRKERGEEIEYSVTVPYKNYIGAGTFWGISDEDNVVTRTYSYSTTSEWVER